MPSGRIFIDASTAGFVLPARPIVLSVSSSTSRSGTARFSWSAVVIAVIVALISYLWNAYSDELAQRAPAEAGSALALLEEIPVKGPASGTGYDRIGDFGDSWLDVDKNGCDTRNDILQRDLDNITRKGSCTVLAGEFNDPYTGTTIDFVRGPNTSSLVQIDHLVALKNAWITGAQQLSREQRVALANDPLNLMAADGRQNSSKGDRDAATWLPENKDFRCEYVARQISVKAKYDLWVVPAEHDAMVRILSSCPEQPSYAPSAR